MILYGAAILVLFIRHHGAEFTVPFAHSTVNVKTLARLIQSVNKENQNGQKPDSGYIKLLNDKTNSSVIELMKKNMKANIAHAIDPDNDEDSVRIHVIENQHVLDEYKKHLRKDLSTSSSSESSDYGLSQFLRRNAVFRNDGSPDGIDLENPKSKLRNGKHKEKYDKEKIVVNLDDGNDKYHVKVDFKDTMNAKHSDEYNDQVQQNIWDVFTEYSHSWLNNALNKVKTNNQDHKNDNYNNDFKKKNSNFDIFDSKNKYNYTTKDRYSNDYINRDSSNDRLKKKEKDYKVIYTKEDNYNDGKKKKEYDYNDYKKKDSYNNESYKKKDYDYNDNYKKKDTYNNDNYKKKDSYNNESYKKKDSYSNDNYKKKDSYNNESYKKKDSYNNDNYKKKDTYNDGYKKKDYDYNDSYKKKDNYKKSDDYNDYYKKKDSYNDGYKKKDKKKEIDYNYDYTDKKKNTYDDYKKKDQNYNKKETGLREGLNQEDDKKFQWGKRDKTKSSKNKKKWLSVEDNYKKHDGVDSWKKKQESVLEKYTIQGKKHANIGADAKPYVPQTYDYYNHQKPKTFQKSAAKGFGRTSIPFVGKKGIYEDK